MKKLMSLLSHGLFFFLVGCCTAQTRISTMPPVVESHKEVIKKQVESTRKIKDYTAAIIDLNSENHFIHCSAVWINRGMLLTANHCVNDESNGGLITYITEDTSDNRVRLAIVKGVDTINDLALLLVDPSTEPQHGIAVLSDGPIESGVELNIMGHTMGNGWSYSKGYVSAIRTNMISPSEFVVEKVVQVSSPAWMGNSGGGAFDVDGNLIGICSWVSLSGPFLTFFIHRDVIEKFLVSESAI